MAEYTFIGDIHSAADDLAVLLADTSITQTRLIFLGDYIDGTAGRHLGHLTQPAPLDPLGVIAQVQQRVRDYGDVALCGNHDDFWVQTAHGDDEAAATWVLNGGHRTWRKLGIYTSNLNTVRRALNQEPLLAATKFLASLPMIWQQGHLVAMHAGVDWRWPLAQQTRDTLLWIRDDYYFDGGGQPHRNLFDRVLVTGHTPVQSFENPQMGYVKLQADAEDTPRYVIDGGSRSGLFDGGICALTLTTQGKVARMKRVINRKIYDGQQLVTPEMVSGS
ncbi:metallophosphoesterase [Lactiplantibacillus pentosus]|uniref:metallophosphoesterase n=1 Tax=Lactiplantibacillus pentosus TaxID=1589 RepID=UPI0021A42102|nr:metallophosphoesterase [Lactiplantibacillus pentosus]MCT3310636.1 serine/threonine protein phosphatase [Lactiplantibacillus pentosus]